MKKRAPLGNRVTTPCSPMIFEFCLSQVRPPTISHPKLGNRMPLLVPRFHYDFRVCLSSPPPPPFLAPRKPHLGPFSGPKPPARSPRRKPRRNSPSAPRPRAWRRRAATRSPASPPPGFAPGSRRLAKPWAHGAHGQRKPGGARVFTQVEVQLSWQSPQKRGGNQDKAPGLWQNYC